MAFETSNLGPTDKILTNQGIQLKSAETTVQVITLCRIWDTFLLKPLCQIFRQIVQNTETSAMLPYFDRDVLG